MSTAKFGVKKSVPAKTTKDCEWCNKAATYRLQIHEPSSLARGGVVVGVAWACDRHREKWLEEDI